MAFKDTDKTVFVGRRADGSLWGVFTVRQWEDQEELLEDHPQVVAFRNAPARKEGEPKPTSRRIDPINPDPK